MMNKDKIIRIAACAAVVVATSATLPLCAAEVAADEARDAVRGWAALQEALTGKERFSADGVAKVETYQGRDGRGSFHVVSFKGGGFAVTSGDTEIAPILAYSEAGEFVADDENPLWVMLTRDVAGRTKRLENLAQSRRVAEEDEDDLEYGAEEDEADATTQNPVNPVNPVKNNSQPSSNASAWTRLKEAAKAPEPTGRPLLKAALPKVDSIPYPIYGPLCETKWNQYFENHLAVYNYYTPSNYLCGCVATAMAQVTELLTNYGEIACFFWDIPSRIDCPEMDALVRRLQPGIMVNDRGWGNKATCDYSTPERDYKWDLSSGRHIEACDSVGVQSWGYRADEDYHTHGYLTRNIDRYLSTGANFLLNVGPKADGTIPDEARAIMAGVGKWYGKVRDSFRNVKTVGGLKLKIAPNAVVTRRDDTLFVHFPTGLDATGLDLRPLTVMPKRATLLNTGKALNARVELMPWNAGSFDRETLHVWGIPADELANECIVLRLDFAPGALDAM